MDCIFFVSGVEFQKWLEENQHKSQELWVGFYKKSAGQTGITYPQAVDQALCYGWIDGIRKSIDESTYKNRFTPRKRVSIWSSVNLKRFDELLQLGLIQPAGLKAFQERNVQKTKLYSYEEGTRKLSAIYEEKFCDNEKAWDYFQAQPAGYQKVTSWWVMSAKKEETRLNRLAILIENSEQGQRITALSRPTKSK